MPNAVDLALAYAEALNQPGHDSKKRLSMVHSAVEMIGAAHGEAFASDFELHLKTAVAYDTLA